ncbi:MAG: hypothetical protein U0Q22_14320 [Acidimicrobiales bacterium]
MKFLRHLLAVSAIVAVVVGIGFAWKASPAASLVADGRDGRDRPGLPAGAPAPPAAVNRTGRFDRDRVERRGAGGISLSNVDDLVQTMFVGVLVLGGVILVDRARRRRNPP